MTTVNIYLTFAGNCEEAFKFYQSVFGGEFPQPVYRLVPHDRVA